MLNVAVVGSGPAGLYAAEALVKQAETMVAAKASNETLQRKQLIRIAGLVARNAVEAKLEDEQKDRLDVAVADGDRIRSVHGFLDKVPAAA